MAVSLLQDSCNRGLEHRAGLTSQIDQGLKQDRDHSDTFHIECVGSARREVEDASGSVRTPVVNSDNDKAAIVEVRHLRVRDQRERAMRCGSGDGVEDLTAGGLSTDEIVPSSFPRERNSSSMQWGTTGV